MRIARFAAMLGCVCVVSVAWVPPGCGGARDGVGAGSHDATAADSQGPDANTSDAGTPCDPSDGGRWADCVDTNCPNGTPASLSGKVYDPAGRNPLYNAVVFVPNDPKDLPTIVSGTNRCVPCGEAIGDYAVATVTDATGAFTLAGVPTGQNVPLVFQVGKWRRMVSVTTHSCTDTVVPASLSRLPRNQSEGDIPQMALLTGACDRLGCFMRSLGLDASEFTGPDAGGRLHIYRGASPSPDLFGGGGGTAGDCSGSSGPCPLWSTKQGLERYDKILLGCECSENEQTKPDKMPMHDWLNEGGDLFAIHVEDTWFKNGPADVQGVANWVNGPAAGAAGPFSIDTSFPNGKVFDRWLAGLGALKPDGTLQLSSQDVSTSVSSVNAPTTGWVHDDSQSPAAVKLLSFSTPIASMTDAGVFATGYCGESVFSDIHPGGGGPGSSAPVPASCSGTAVALQDLALEFLFFHEVGCAEGTRPPGPPPFPLDN